MKNDSGSIDNRSQIRAKTVLQFLDQNGLDVFGTEFDRIDAAGTDQFPDFLQHVLNFGNDEFAARTPDPHINRRAQQQLINRGDLAKKVLLVGHVHSAISTQWRNPVNRGPEITKQRQTNELR